MENRRLPVLAPLALALAWSLVLAPVPAGAQGVRKCAELVVADSNADFGPGLQNGAVIDVDLDEAVDLNTSIVGGSDITAFLSDIAVGLGRQMFLTDLEADLSGFGPDPNGNSGRGGVFAMEPQTGSLSLLSDGSQCSPPMICNPSVFVDPVSIAYSTALDLLVVADPDADPSGFGPDTNRFAGHGGVFAVDPVDGLVSLLSDGSQFMGIPPGEQTIFQDPISVAFGRDGRLFVADQLSPASPFGGNGAVFEVDVTSGVVTLIASSSLFRGIRDIAVEPDGKILILDRLAATGGGALFRVDPNLAPVSQPEATYFAQNWVEPAGLAVAGDGRIFVLDTSADPLATGAAGAMFEIDPQLLSEVAVSATPQYLSPWGVSLLEAEALEEARPAVGDQGQSLTVVLTGGVFNPVPTVDFGTGITVDAVRWVSDTQVDVDITIGPAAATGPRDVTVVNANWTSAFHCDLFEVNAIAGCAPSSPVGESLRLERIEGQVKLSWDGIVNPCLARYRVHRAFTAYPAVGGGDWPDDPAFESINDDDLDLSDEDTTFRHVPTAGEDEYYVIVPIGSNGTPGPSGHYP